VWADELHVKESLKLYQEKYQLADNMLNNFEGYTAPEAGFFIWLKVKDGEKLTLNLWKNHSIQVLPGAYLANQNHPDYSQINPGKHYIRIALVSTKEEITKSLAKIIFEENLI
jgi:aspartate/methionine/tyrosine aminotransferase